MHCMHEGISNLHLWRSHKGWRRHKRSLLQPDRPRKSKSGPEAVCVTGCDLYSVLGIDAAATQADIRHAYRTCAKSCHPDVDSSLDARARFEAVADAYSVLSDRRLRNRYNKHGSRGLGRRFAKYGGRPHGRPGADVTAFVGLSFAEAALGARRTVSVLTQQSCFQCGGAGSPEGDMQEDCPLCRGTGEVLRYRTGQLGRTGAYGVCPACGGRGISMRQWCTSCAGQGCSRQQQSIGIQIPPGVDRKSMLRLPGHGDAGPGGGPCGDLYIRFRIHDHQEIRRDGLHVWSDLPVSYLSAILGGEQTVMVLRGQTLLQVPAGTQHDQVLKLAGQGVQRTGPDGRIVCGDHYVKVQVRLPTAVNAAEDAVFQQLLALQCLADDPA